MASSSTAQVGTGRDWLAQQLQAAGALVQFVVEVMIEDWVEVVVLLYLALMDIVVVEIKDKVEQVVMV
jgi:hypothetical protein